MDWHFVGVDLGQAKDFTAIAAVERAELTGAIPGAAGVTGGRSKKRLLPGRASVPGSKVI
jgi:hypothetical protein